MPREKVATSLMNVLGKEVTSPRAIFTRSLDVKLDRVILPAFVQQRLHRAFEIFGVARHGVGHQVGEEFPR
jgi:hypothetical protein